MIWALLIAHLGVCGLLVAVGHRLGRRGLLVGALPPAATAIWAASRIGAEPLTADVTWVAGLDLALTLRVDQFAVLMTLLVSGIGALIFVYAYGYFAPDASDMGRFASTLLAFSAAMLGLVWSDSIWALFIFWELTSVTSFLLVGHKSTDDAVLTAARRALMITGAGGLVLLAGMLVLADAAGTTLLSELQPVEGATATVAAILVMVAAATKSAQVPFHVWLPGAMVAPTPVSAYLHSATMVKAGVVLVAVVGPALGGIAAWKSIGLTFGVVSMLWGGVGALRHRDAKLVLAWGTISQLGLLITLLSVGTAKAVFAATSLLLAHALFKAALFLVVGEIDVRAGTRDIDQLGGLARAMPVAFAVAVAAGLSMAGAPPLLGFAAKEAAVEAVLGLGGVEALIAGLGVIGGSVLTVAYTLRLLVGLFGAGPRVTLSPARAALTVPAAVLGAAGVLGYLALGSVDGLVRSAAVRLDPGAEVYQLLRWPGLTTGLAVSFAILTVGSALGLALLQRPPSVPGAAGARSTDALLDNVIVTGRMVCARIQHGSLPVYVATMVATAALAAVPFAVDLTTEHLMWWDTPLQILLAVAVLVAAVAVAAVKTRLGAALALGSVGIGVAALFVVHGAPDLVLTQLLVETVVVVAFVIGFSQLSREFPPVGASWRLVRLAVAASGGIAVMVALAAASSAPTGEPVADRLVTAAVDEGGGNNVVNVILTDIRALDTIGEVVVLATVAIGIRALARTRARPLEAAP